MKWNVLFRWCLFWVLAFGLVAGMLAPVIGCGLLNDPAIALLGLDLVHQNNDQDLQDQIDAALEQLNTHTHEAVDHEHDFTHSHDFVDHEHAHTHDFTHEHPDNDDGGCEKVTVCHNGHYVPVCENSEVAQNPDGDCDD